MLKSPRLNRGDFIFSKFEVMKKMICGFVTLLLFTSVVSKARCNAVLVMLKSESNRIKYFESKKNISEASRVREEADEIISVTINDFTDHFNYCPVYYFMDTNLALVKQKKFEGVLFDGQKRIFATPPLDKNDSNYLIVYYGTPSPNLEPEYENNTYRNVRYHGTGSIILGPDFKRKGGAHPFYLYIPEISELFYSPDKRYNFISKKYNMAYKQQAGVVNNALRKYSGG